MRGDTHGRKVDARLGEGIQFRDNDIARFAVGRIAVGKISLPLEIPLDTDNFTRAGRTFRGRFEMNGLTHF